MSAFTKTPIKGKGRQEVTLDKVYVNKKEFWCLNLVIFLKDKGFFGSSRGNGEQ